LTQPLNEGFYVTPTVTPIDFRLLPVRMAGEEKSAEQAERGDGAVLMGLHEFVPGDNPRRIHWKSSAKLADSWMVREMDKEEREEIIFICPDAAQMSLLSDVEIESRVSFLASALAACRRNGFLSHVLCEDRLVSDEEAFLSLWDPRIKSDPLLAAHLGEISSAKFISASKQVDIEEAYRVGHAG
jgi:hypothetical protein